MTTTTRIDDIVVNNDGDGNADVNVDYAEGTIVVVAKCPTPGKSKTRLIPILGDAAAILAKSMLSDVIKTIQGCSELNRVQKVLLFAPGNLTGFKHMKQILDDIDVPYYDNENDTNDNNDDNNNDKDDQHQHQNHTRWYLLPMISSLTPSFSSYDDNDDDLQSNDLGSKLKDSLIRIRQLNYCSSLQQQQQQQQQQQYDIDNDNDSATNNKSFDNCCHGIVYVGMDAPILPLYDIVVALQNAKSSSLSLSGTGGGIATVCPADDGGYGMVCVPSQSDPLKTFTNMYWSHPLTAISQIKCFTDQNISIKIGQLMYDIDEPNDLQQFIIRNHHYLTTNDNNNHINNTTGSNSMRKNLQYPSSGIWSSSYSDLNTAAATSNTITSLHPACYYTRQTLKETNVWPF